MTNPNFLYSACGMGKPQILLLGNGLEYKSGQVSWAKLLEQLRVDTGAKLLPEELDKLPFPLLYHLLTTPCPAPAHLTREDMAAEDQRLTKAMGGLVHQSNEFLDRLPGLGVDHIMTTNYSYCVEQAFYPGEDFLRHRTKRLFYLEKDPKTDKPVKEKNYKLHTGYLVKSGSREIGIWHIHGEAAVTGSVVLGHDRYGRLLRRVELECSKRDYAEQRRDEAWKFTSWPELFLFGDVYILGLNLLPHEFDLWWLLRRKQREVYSAGQTYFYERSPRNGFRDSKHLLLQSYGVTLCDAGCDESADYDRFYHAALTDIAARIQAGSA